MEYIFKFIEYINENDILNWGLLIFAIGYLIYLHSKKEEPEEYLGMKLVGFYLLGAFTFNFNFGSFPLVIPIGFIIYFAFMRYKERANPTIKKKSAVLGLIILGVGLSNSIIYNAIEYRDREIPVKSISVKSLRDDYEILKQELGLSDTVGVESFNLDYDKNNKIRRLDYNLEDIEKKKYYYIAANSNSYSVYVSKKYDNDYDYFMYTVMYNLGIEDLLDVVSNTKFKKYKDASYYSVIYRDEENHYEEDHNLYTVDLGNFSTKKLNSKYPVYDAVDISYMPMKQVSGGSWESKKTDIYLIRFSIDESLDEDLYE